MSILSKEPIHKGVDLLISVIIHVIYLHIFREFGIDPGDFGLDDRPYLGLRILDGAPHHVFNHGQIRGISFLSFQVRKGCAAGGCDI